MQRPTQQQFIGAFEQLVHDIRSPLSVLSALSDSADLISEETRSLIRSATERIKEIADHFMVVIVPSCHTPSSDVAKPVSEIMERVILEKRIEWSHRPEVRFESILCDSSVGSIPSGSLSTVFSNLLNNAVESIEAAGEVAVTVASNATQVIIEIADTGRGISADILPRLMKKGATFGKEGGRGFGLYHAKRTLEKYQGSIALESSLGQGTSVILRIPKAPSFSNHFGVDDLTDSGGT